MNEQDSIVNEDSLVVPSQEEISIFPNLANGITIKSVFDGKTVLIMFQPCHAKAIIKAIRAAVSDLKEIADA